MPADHDHKTEQNMGQRPSAPPAARAPAAASAGGGSAQGQSREVHAAAGKGDLRRQVAVAGRQADAEDEHIARISGKGGLKPGEKQRRMQGEERKTEKVLQDGKDPDYDMEKLLLDAGEANDDLQNVSMELADACKGATSAGPPLKGTTRIEEKKGKYGGSFLWFTDVARSSLVFESPRDLVTSAINIRKVLGRFNIKPVGLKNRFAEPTPTGYMDILVNLHVPIEDGRMHNTELQLHLKDMHAAKTKPVEIDEQTAAKLSTSAKELIALEAQEPSVKLEDSMPTLQKISQLKAKDELKGHDLYKISRYLNENHKDLTKGSQDGKLGGVHLKETAELWDKIALEKMYGPAGAGLQEETPPKEWEALKAIKNL